MKIQTRVSIGDVQPNGVIELPEDEANSLIAQGYAQTVESSSNKTRSRKSSKKDEDGGEGASNEEQQTEVTLHATQGKEE